MTSSRWAAVVAATGIIVAAIVLSTGGEDSRKAPRTQRDVDGAALVRQLLTVEPGQSIQTVIDRAQPGDTIRLRRGTYHENLAVYRGPLTIRGRAVLRPAARTKPTLCDAFSEEHETSGICVAGSAARHVRISGLTISGFPGSGIIAVFTRDLDADHNELRANGGYGIFGHAVTRVRFRDNLAKENADAGFYVGEAPTAHALMVNNRSIDNDDPGFLVRSTTFTTIVSNFARGNCAGILALGHAPDETRAFRIRRNRVVRNTRSCSREPEDYIPALSGLGIGVLGADSGKVEQNFVVGHYSRRRSGISGGIVVRSASGKPARSNRIVGNRMHGNKHLDLYWDRKGTNRFTANRCLFGDPPDLCVRSP